MIAALKLLCLSTAQDLQGVTCDIRRGKSSSVFRQDLGRDRWYKLVRWLQHQSKARYSEYHTLAPSVYCNSLRLRHILRGYRSSIGVPISVSRLSELSRPSNSNSYNTFSREEPLWRLSLHVGDDAPAGSSASARWRMNRLNDGLQAALVVHW